MALINPNLYIGEIGDRLKLIRHPGQDDERVIFTFDLSDKRNVARAIASLANAPTLEEDEKFRAAFWLGYFYAHKVRPELPFDLEARIGDGDVRGY